jgi:hypothetical protein
MYIIARNISGPRLRCEALMVDKKSFTPWPPVTEDGWRRAYKFRDRLMAEVVRLEIECVKFRDGIEVALEAKAAA